MFKYIYKTINVWVQNMEVVYVCWMVDWSTYISKNQTDILAFAYMASYKNVRLLSFYRLSSPHSICSILPGRLKICRSNLCFSLACFMSCPFLLKLSSHSKQRKSSSTFCFFMFLDYTFVATVWKILNFSSIPSKNLFMVNFSLKVFFVC